MACTNGHDTCLGPACTKANGPKRPPTPEVKARMAMMDSLREMAEKCYGYVLGESATSIKLSFYNVQDATQFVIGGQRITGGLWQVRLFNRPYGTTFYVVLTLKKAKV